MSETDAQALPEEPTRPTAPSTPAPAKRRKKLSPGWIPEHHGAWAMITIPAISGALLAGFELAHVWLLAFWWIGYFFYQAAMLWLKSRRKAKYFPPVRAYAIAMVPFGIAVALTSLDLAVWVIAFAPMIGISVWATTHKKERSYLNDSATVLAAATMLAVTFDAGSDWSDPLWPWVWMVMAVQFLYFWGTVPHIKALIRDRNKPGAARFSFGYHLTVFVAITTTVAAGWFETALLGGWFLAGVWALIAVRSFVMPRWQRTKGPIRPLIMGNTEVVISLLIATAVLV